MLQMGATGIEEEKKITDDSVIHGYQRFDETRCFQLQGRR
jgi:hypothetical protein